LLLPARQRPQISWISKTWGTRAPGHLAVTVHRLNAHHSRLSHARSRLVTRATATFAANLVLSIIDRGAKKKRTSPRDSSRMLMLMEALRFASWPSLPSRRDSSSPRYAPTRRGDVPEQSRHAFAVRSEGEGKFVTGKLAVMAVRMAITCRVGGTNFLRDLAPTRWATYR